MRSRSRIFDPDLSAQVAALFASLGSTPKLWLDPSDPAARFQDQAGTTLITADGQPYGRANDKSGAANNVGQATTTSRPLWKTDGVLSWAQADGTDDSWQSLASLDLTTTDKVTVIAGIRKESDVAIGVLAELSAAATSNAGTFAIFAPNSAGLAQITFFASGTSGQSGVLTAVPAPITRVVTGQADIAAPSTSIRGNGAAGTTSTATLGTGSFGNFLLNIFRRNNASLPFNGRLYGLMVIGRLLTADELSLCERYMAQKSGVTL